MSMANESSLVALKFLPICGGSLLPCQLYQGCEKVRLGMITLASTAFYMSLNFFVSTIERSCSVLAAKEVIALVMRI